MTTTGKDFVDAFGEATAKVDEARRRHAPPEEINQLWWDAVEVLECIRDAAPNLLDELPPLPPMAEVALDVVRHQYRSKARH